MFDSLITEEKSQGDKTFGPTNAVLGLWGTYFRNLAARLLLQVKEQGAELIGLPK